MVSKRKSSTNAQNEGASDHLPKRTKVGDSGDNPLLPPIFFSNEREHEETEPELPSKTKRKAPPKKFDESSFPPRHESSWKVGAHVSAAGGVENAIMNASAIGYAALILYYNLLPELIAASANAFALFLKSQRRWTSPPLTATSISSFKARMKEFGYPSRMILPHGSYLINLGNIDAYVKLFLRDPLMNCKVQRETREIV